MSAKSADGNSDHSIYKVHHLKMDDLLDNPIQPPWRTFTDDKSKLLRRTIEEDGQIDPIYVASVPKYPGKFVKINGHRRCSIMVDLGFSTVVARIVKAKSLTEAEQMFININAGNKAMRGNDRFYSWAKSDDRELYISKLTKDHRREIDAMIQVFGTERCEELATREPKGTGPSVGRHVLDLHRQFKLDELSSPKMKSTGEWMLYHSETTDVMLAMRRGKKTDLKRIISCIKANRAYRHT